MNANDYWSMDIDVFDDEPYFLLAFVYRAELLFSHYEPSKRAVPLSNFLTSVYSEGSVLIMFNTRESPIQGV